MENSQVEMNFKNMAISPENIAQSSFKVSCDVDVAVMLQAECPKPCSMPSWFALALVILQLWRQGDMHPEGRARGLGFLTTSRHCWSNGKSYELGLIFLATLDQSLVTSS